MADLTALLALHSLSGARLSAILRGVTFLFAVAASEGIDALFETVTGTVAFLLTVDALNDWLRRQLLRLLLFAMLSRLA
jgi:hypothetical protein